jgi:hypothetical protein
MRSLFIAPALLAAVFLAPPTRAAAPGPATRPEVRSSAALVVDASDSSVLFARRDDAAVPIASITKLMTALVVTAGRQPLDEKLTITAADRDQTRGSASRLDDLASPAFVGRRQEHFAMVATTTMRFAPSGEHEEAGLTVFMNNEHHAELFVSLREGNPAVILRRRVGDVCDRLPPLRVPEADIVLGISCDGARYHFWCESPGRNELGSLAARLLSPEIAHEGGAWSGMYVGIYASGNGRPCGSPADFDRFTYEGTELK